MSAPPPEIGKYWGVVFNLWRDEPIYHRLVVGQHRTVCGRPVGVHTDLLPMKHLTKFARVCKGCS